MRKAIYLLLILQIIAPLSAASAQEYRNSYSLADDSVPVLRMERSYGGAPIGSAPSRTTIPQFVGATSEEEARVMKKVMEHVQSLPSKLENLVVLKPLPECTKSLDVALPVYAHTRGSEYFDYVFYDPADAEQQVRADRWGPRAVPFSAGTGYGANNAEQDPRPLLALALGVRCLPARVNFEYHGSQRVLSYREGHAAWTESDRDEHMNDYGAR